MSERVDASRVYLFAEGQKLLRDAVTCEPDRDYELKYEPIDPRMRVIVRLVNGELRAEIGEVLL